MPDHATPSAGIGLESATDGGPRTLRGGVSGTLRWGVLALGLGACGESPPPALEVGPVGFTEEELGVLGAAEQRTLADLTALGLAVAEQRVDSVIQPHLERDLRSLVHQRLAMELAADRAGLGDAELMLAYDLNPRHELVVRHLVVMSERWRPEEHRDSARAVAMEALQRAQDGEPFAELAGEYSDEPGAAARGGLLEPGREGSWVPEFWRAASALEEGQLSPVVATEFGFHVIQLEERRRVPFDEVREDVLEDVMDLPLALGRAEEWGRRRMEVARVDTPAVRSALGGSDEAGVLVRWPDSLGIPPLDAEAFKALNGAGPGGDMEEAADTGLAGALDLVHGAAQTHALMHHARERGISPSPSQVAAMQRRWRGRVAGWAEALGFEEGMSRQQVKEQALRSLGTPAQNAAIARSELAEVSLRLRDLYPVRTPDPEEDGAAEAPSSN